MCYTQHSRNLKNRRFFVIFEKSLLGVKCKKSVHQGKKKNEISIALHKQQVALEIVCKLSLEWIYV